MKKARVLVTRPAGRADTLARILTGRGASVACRPAIEFAPPADAAPVRGAIDRIDQYDWVVVTSPTAVEFFVEALVAGRSAAALAGRVAVVGPGTARALERHGVTPSLVAERSDSEGLGRALVGELTPGANVLLVRPERSGSTLGRELASVGATVDSVVFYRTVAACGVDAIAREIVEGSYDVVVFSAPSTLESLLAAGARARVLAALGDVRRVAIGAVTQRALVAAGIAPHAVARRPTDEGIADAVFEAIQHTA